MVVRIIQLEHLCKDDLLLAIVDGCAAVSCLLVFRNERGDVRDCALFHLAEHFYCSVEQYAFPFPSGLIWFCN